MQLLTADVSSEDVVNAADGVNDALTDEQYEQLVQKIYLGRAWVHELRQALSEDEPHHLTNIVHAMFAMREDRGVHNMLRRMWEKDKTQEPELAWERLSVAPVRIALASTINRIQIAGTDEYLAYIRSYKYDDSTFNRAQAVIALGLNGDLDDLDYLQSMADGDDRYVAQTAITSLALMVSNKARDVMIELLRKYKDSERGDLLTELLQISYHWSEDDSAEE